MHNSSLIVKRSILSGTWNGAYRATLDMPKFKSPELVDGLLTEVMPEEIWTKRVISDLKGRDKDQYISQPKSSSFSTRAEEIAFVAGTIKLSERDRSPFVLSLLSNFAEFKGSSHIVYRVDAEQEGEFASEISFRNVGISLPIEISEFRFALQNFSPRFFSMLGMAPVVTDSLLVEGDQSSVKILLEFESKKSRDSLPFQRDGIFEKLGKLTGLLFGLNVFLDFQERLK